MITKLVILLLVLMPVAASAAGMTIPGYVPVTFESPAGVTRVEIGVEPGGRLWYGVRRSSVTMLNPSPLGIVVDGVDLGSKIVGVYMTDPVEGHETYASRGADRTAVNYYREVTLVLWRSAPGDVVTYLIVRAYDDGVAYRYAIAPNGLARTVSGESSAWSVPAGATCWAQTNTANYEGFLVPLPIGTVDADVGGPLTCQLPSSAGYVLLSEAALRDYSGMTYDIDVGSLTVRAEFMDDAAWPLPASSTTPWRLVIAAPSLDSLVNSDLITNLSDPPDPALFPHGAATPWVKPGRALWPWLTNRMLSADFDTMMAYVNEAAALRAEYVVVDAGWEIGFRFSGSDQFTKLNELVRRGRWFRPTIGIWVWKDWTELEDPAVRRAFFQAVKNAGAVGVKVDDIHGTDSDSVANIRMQESILRDAAELHLMINFHGVNKATGLFRTWPNEITHEGFAGNEANGLWEQGVHVPPSHNAALPFTRLVAGPGDFGPLLLDKEKRGATTVGHQVATLGLYHSPLIHYAQDPFTLRANTTILEFTRSLPVEWDETRVLPNSAIGSLAALARRRGSRWYLFVAEGQGVPQSIELSLSFLDHRQYNVAAVEDETRDTVKRQTHMGVTRAGTLNVSLLGGGGYAAVLSPAPDRSRPVHQGFTSFPPSATESGSLAAYSVLREHADVVAHSYQEGVPWLEAAASSDYRDYSFNLRRRWEQDRMKDEVLLPSHRRYLMLNPIDTATYAGLAPHWGEWPYQPLPYPWTTYAFDHPAVKEAFLNYAIAAVEFFQPTYLAIAIESNILLVQAPHKWWAYRALNEYVYNGLKQRYPNLLVFSTIHYEHMIGLTSEGAALTTAMGDVYPDVLTTEVKALLRHSDLLALSTYPFMIAGNVYMGPTGMLDKDYYDAAYELARGSGKRVAIEQMGYISRNLYLEYLGIVFPGSEEMQDAFINLALSAAHVYDFEFVINFIGWDYGENYGSFPTSLTWAWTGLVRENGSPKPALDTWTTFREP